jgi:hypothetical protein
MLEIFFIYKLRQRSVSEISQVSESDKLLKGNIEVDPEWQTGNREAKKRY